MFSKRITLTLVVLFVLCFSLACVSATQDNTTTDELTVDENIDVHSNDDLDELNEDDNVDGFVEPNENFHDDVNSTIDPKPAEHIADDEREEIYPHIDIPQYVLVGDEYSEISVEFNQSDISGNLTILIDGDEVYYEPVIPYNDEYNYNSILISSLDLKPGNHSVSFLYSGDENYKPFESLSEYWFDLYYLKLLDYYEEYLNYWIDESNSQELSLKHAGDITGTVDVFIDGKKINSYNITDLYEGSLIQIPISTDDYNPTLGRHSFNVNYYKGNYPDINLTDYFNVDYHFNMENYELEYDRPIYYGPISFLINIPDDKTKNISLNANGKIYNIQGNDCDEYIFEDLKFGENNLTFSYEDKKYPLKTISYNFIVYPKIQVPEEFYVNGDENITLILPSDASGNLSVYNVICDYETSEYDVTYDIIKTTPVKNGQASISLSDLKMGGYDILIKYDGNDYNVTDYRNVIHIKPKLIYQKTYFINGTNNYITIESSKNTEGNLSVVLITRKVGKRMSIQLYNDVVKDELTLMLPQLNLTSYSIGVNWDGDDDWDDYDDDGYKDSWSYGFFRVSDIDPNIELDVDFESKVYWSNAEHPYVWYKINIPDIDDDYSPYYNITIYIDGKFKENYDDDSGSICVDDLSIGNHTWRIDRKDESGYYKSISKSGTFEIGYIYIPDEIIVNHDYVEYSDYIIRDAGYLTLFIDGKFYAREFKTSADDGDEYGHSSIKFENLSVGTHDYEIIFLNDKTNEKLVQKGTFNASIFNCFDDWGNSFDFELPDDATGTVTVSINNKIYTAKVENGTANIRITDLDDGEYEFVAKYSGDNKYHSQNLTGEFDIYNYYGLSLGWNEKEQQIIELDLPEGNGVLSIYLCEKYFNDEYEEDYEIVKNLTKIKVNSRHTEICINDLGLPFGHYHILAKYSNNDEENDYSRYFVSILPEVNITRYITLGKTAKITMDLDNIEGNITININGNKFKTVEIKDGKINVEIPSDKLSNHNKITFEYSGDDFYSDIFSRYYDNDCEEWRELYYRINVNLDLTVSNFTSKGLGEITIDLPENVKGNLTVYVNDKNISNTSVNGGKIQLPLSITENGKCILKIEFIDENGRIYTGYDEFYIPKVEVKNNISKSIDGNETKFSINLPDDATGTLYVYVGDNEYESELKNGEATVIIPNKVDSTQAIVKYTGDKKYNGFNLESNHIQTENLNKNNNTNDNGNNDNHKNLKTKVKPKITAKKKTFKKSKKVKKYTITLKAGKKPVKKVKVYLKIGKKTFNTKTNNKGKATFKIKKLTKKGKYKSKIIFKGNKLYKAVSKKVIIKIK